MPSFSKKSLAALANGHPLLVEILNEAIKNVDFSLLDSYRGEAAQEHAFQTGHSKAHFGQSAHNYKPCVAFDWMPYPFTGWNDFAAFKKCADAMFAALPIVRQRHNLPHLDIRWGGDWHKDGNKTTNDQWDAGHIELDPWRNYIKGN